MKKAFQIFFSLAVVLLLAFLFFQCVFAKTDLSITATDITFSKTEPLAGEKIRIFARVFNVGDNDVYGFVTFLKDDKEIADPQPISVKINTYDDVFIDWISAAGTHKIEAKIIGTNPKDDDSENNAAIFENYLVDLDSDADKIGDNKDTDDDNDDLSDEEEKIKGTNPLKPDTDGDKARDSIDPFPLDATEWQDADKDSIGDNKDIDDDNDELTDDEESFILGTNPLKTDSDDDGFPDKKEITIGTSALQKDTDGDGVIDSEDDFPLDPNKFQASLFEAFKSILEKRGLSFNKILIGAGILIALILLLSIRKRPRLRSHLR